MEAEKNPPIGSTVDYLCEQSLKTMENLNVLQGQVSRCVDIIKSNQEKIDALIKATCDGCGKCDEANDN